MNGNNFTVLFNRDYTVSQLAGFMVSGEEVMIDSGKEMVCGVITGMRMEDGSGFCWLITIKNQFDSFKGKEVFIRTK